MVDYTKFKMKARNELVELLDDKDKFYIVACKKCFKKFQIEDEPECNEFSKLLQELGKELVGSIAVDFLCNKPMTEKKLKHALTSKANSICVISCGLGISTVAQLANKPVYAASDSICFDGRHGMALTEKLCNACGQCYLNLTGGICPIVDCSKSLINGQCGGSKGYKCEVGKEKDCAWDRIYQRLDARNRTDILHGLPIGLRNYSKVNHKLVNDYVNAVRNKRLSGFYGGVHPTGNKAFTEHFPIKTFPSPKTVTIPLLQHEGAPAQPLVKIGDQVLTGQKIGRAVGSISANIHASISGIVTAIEDRRHPDTELISTAIVIESDGKDELCPSITPVTDWDKMSAKEIAKLIREKGIVGLGGAGFPTAVKLLPPKPIDTVIVNGCECEPLLTSDHRVMLEYADEILFGLTVMLKTLGAHRGIIVIEDNKQDAIKLLEEKTAHIRTIEIRTVTTKYPQGAEKLLIKRVLDRHVSSGLLPFDLGVVVSNVSTVKAISDAIVKGLPLIERVLTVGGANISKPGNYLVKIGTSVDEIIDYCGALTDESTDIKLGGPMMGAYIDELNVPVIKTTGAVLAINKEKSEPNPCIRCGRCADVCPMELLPLYYPIYAGEENVDGLIEKAVTDCIECGCCEYICSSKIPLRMSIRYGKRVLAETEGSQVCLLPH